MLHETYDGRDILDHTFRETWNVGSVKGHVPESVGNSAFASEVVGRRLAIVASASQGVQEALEAIGLFTLH